MSTPMTNLGAKWLVWDRYSKRTYHATIHGGNPICGTELAGNVEWSVSETAAASTYNPLSASRKRNYPRKPCKRCMKMLERRNRGEPT